MRTANHQALTRPRQHGAALLVMLVILITGGAYLLVSQLNRGSGRIEADRQTSEALAQAKEALIGWAVSRLDPSWPGMLPHPDRNTDAPNYYDGMSDCLTGTIVGTPQLLLGKIPRVGIEPPCSGPQTPLSIDSVDAAGEVLWYAVSRNLVRGGAIAPINPNLLLAATPTYPWLTVRNSTGGILSSRVAFLIIAPGAVVGTQNRAGLGPGPIQFLDSYTVPLSGLTYSNTDFDGAYDDGSACERLTTPRFCEDFIQGDPTDPSNSFNDRLLFVTIDELMPLIELRVAGEARQRLLEYFVVPRNFPYAADLNGGGACVNLNTRGLIPIGQGDCAAAFPITAFPGWFGVPNNWQNFVYYTVAPACVEGTTNCTGAPNTFLTVGTTTNVRALVIGTGRTLNGVVCNASSPPPYNQIVAGPDVCDYLDTAENTDADDNYAGVGQPITNIFNDQAIIVAP